MLNMIYNLFSLVRLSFIVRLSRVPSSMLVGLLGVLIDVPIITILSLYKSPYMLLKGWQQLLHDLIGRKGPFLETACVPFAGLAIILWPLAVGGAVIAAFISSFFLGLYGSIVAYQVFYVKYLDIYTEMLLNSVNCT